MLVLGQVLLFCAISYFGTVGAGSLWGNWGPRFFSPTVQESRPLPQHHREGLDLLQADGGRLIVSGKQPWRGPGRRRHQEVLPSHGGRVPDLQRQGGEVNNKEEGSSFSAQRATLPFMEEKCKVINMFTESSVGCPGCERSWRRIGWQPACLASFLLRQTNIPETKGTPWAETPFWALRSW